MGKPRRPFLAFVLAPAVGFAALAAAPLANASACDNPAVLRVALIPKSHAQQQLQTLAPLLTTLESTLKRRVELSMPSSYGAVIEGLLRGTVDVAELGPASYASLMARAPAVEVFAALAAADSPASGRPGTYHALLLTQAHSGLDSVAQLKGKRLSLTDPVSTTGALLPSAAILQLTGHALEAHFGSVSYAGSHDRALQALSRGRVDAAFVASTRLKEALRTGQVQAGEFQELWRSPPVPTNPYVLRTRLCADLKAGVRHSFVQPSAGHEAMYRRMGTGPFVAASATDYRAIVELLSASAAGGSGR